MDNITRVCRKCGREKPLSEFVKAKDCALGHRYTCKQCRWEYDRKWRAKNLEKERTRARNYRADNLEKVRERSREWVRKNPEKMRKGASNRCEMLYDSYLRIALKRCNLPITPEMIDYKRIQLKLYREIKNQQNDERD